MTLRRLDAELVRRSLARSREEARSLVEGGRVLVRGASVLKPDSRVDDAAAIEVIETTGEAPFASRGGAKLAGALDAFPGLQVAGRSVLDAGASTGGFTDVLLRRGAARVIAVDVGYGQLAWSLRSDPRVQVMDRTNVRSLQAADLPFRPSLVVADLSFISLSTVLPALAACVSEDGDMLLMVKPQFEVGREHVGRGVVSDPALRLQAVQKVADAGALLHWGLVGAVRSPLPGPAGNVEFFLWMRAIGVDREARVHEDGGMAPLADPAEIARVLRSAVLEEPA